MPIWNHADSPIRVETNVQGKMVDNDEWVADKSALEHQQVPSEPWAQGYEQAQAETAEMERKIRELYEEFGEVKPDPSLTDANEQDLKQRNLNK